MLLIGLTGGICCGKSNIATIFKGNNFPVIDQDILAREVVIPGSIGLNEIIKTFGIQYIDGDNLNRQKLAELVFSDKDKLNQLNFIMSPLINNETTKLLENYKINNCKAVLIDSPLLIESGNYVKYHPIIVAGCTQEQQLVRLMKRNLLSEQQALNRINSQITFEQKKKFANYIIDTSCHKDETKKKVLEIINDLKKLM